MNITIRPATQCDAESLMYLFTETVHTINSRDYSSEQVAAWAPLETEAQQWRERQDSRTTFVAEAEGKIVGFGELKEELEGVCHLDCLYCHANHQRQGVGTRLLTAIVDEARKRGLQGLYTDASITARPFFERQGFTVITPQEVEYRGVRFLNFRMECGL